MYNEVFETIKDKLPMLLLEKLGAISNTELTDRDKNVCRLAMIIDWLATDYDTFVEKYVELTADGIVIVKWRVFKLVTNIHPKSGEVMNSTRQANDLTIIQAFIFAVRYI